MTRRDPRVQIPTDVWVLVAAAFVVAIGYGLVAPVLPQFAQSFDVSYTAASVVVSAFAFFRLVFAPVGGSLVDRLGERRVYMTGLLIVAVSTAAAGLAQNYWQLLVLRGLGGIGSTMFTISAMALIVRLSPPAARGKVAGIYASAFLLGGVAGPALGGLVGSWGMRLPFFVYAGFLLVATAVVWIKLSEGRAARPAATGDAPEPVLTVREAITDRAYVLAMVSSFANGWASFGVRVAIVPLFAAHAFGGTDGINEAGASGLALASFAVGTAVIVGVAGRIADSIGRRPLIVGGSIINGAATMALGLAATFDDFGLVYLVGMSALAGLGAGLVNPAQQAVVADILGAERSGGKVMAAFQMAMDVGAIAGPVVIGMVADRWGFNTAFLVTGTLLVGAGVAWLFGRETLHDPERDLGPGTDPGTGPTTGPEPGSPRPPTDAGPRASTP